MSTGADTAEPPEAVGELTVELSDVPPAVRRRLAEFAAAAVPDLSEPELPPAIRPFVAFTAAKRARLGAAALLDALEGRPAFRAAVVHWTRSNRPAELSAEQPDRVSAAAVAILLGRPDATDLVAEIDRRGEDAALRRQRDEAVARVERLESEAARLRTELDAARSAAQGGPDGSAAEAERLRGRLRDQGVRLRRALDEAAEIRASHTDAMGELQDQLRRATTELDRERERAAQADRRAERLAAELASLRSAAREGRRADEMRLALLLDALSGAAAGLRRELDLTPGDGPRPADLVGGAAAMAAGGAVSDVAGFDRLLALPGVHLVVDGYNVTKTGYPGLTLSDQRDRLVGLLAVLAARTGAEVTVAFDGAAVTAPAAGTRGVRVLFSAPGVLADDLIRDLVSAEPPGRPIVVVTSDREVVLSVRSAGAHTAPSTVLVERLAKV